MQAFAACGLSNPTCAFCLLCAWEAGKRQLLHTSCGIVHPNNTGQNCNNEPLAFLLPPVTVCQHCSLCVCCLACELGLPGRLAYPCVFHSLFCVFHSLFYVFHSFFCVFHSLFCVFHSLFYVIHAFFCVFHSLFYVIHAFFCVFHALFCVFHAFFLRVFFCVFHALFCEFHAFFCAFHSLFYVFRALFYVFHAIFCVFFFCVFHALFHSKRRTRLTGYSDGQAAWMCLFGQCLINVCWLLACLTSQQHTSVSQGRICTDNFTCCHTEIQVADPTFYLTQSQYTDTGPTSPSADPITPVRVSTGVPILKSLV